MATTNGLATLIWVLLFFGALAIFYVFFSIKKKKSLGYISKMSQSTEKNPIAIEITPVSPTQVTTDVEGAATAPVRSIFGKFGNLKFYLFFFYDCFRSEDG